MRHRRDCPEPQISVVIPCHDAAHTIGLQLAALDRQEGAPPFEVIVVDNRSGDDLASVITRWQESLDLRLVQAPALANSGYARNVGVAHARSARIGFCDADDVVAVGWVREAFRALDHTEVVNGLATPTADERFAHGLHHLLARAEQDVEPGVVEVTSAPVAYPLLLGCSCAIRRQTFESVGGFDTAVPHGIEDNDLALRLQAQGRLIGRARGMGLAYRIRPPGSDRWRRAFRAGRQHLLLAHRHDLFGRSPSLPRGWYFDLARCLGAAVLMVVQPSRRDWSGLMSRASLAAGALMGHLHHGIAGAQPEPRPGVGLDDTVHDGRMP